MAIPPYRQLICSQYSSSSIEYMTIHWIVHRDNLVIFVLYHWAVLIIIIAVLVTVNIPTKELFLIDLYLAKGSWAFHVAATFLSTLRDDKTISIVLRMADLHCSVFRHWIKVSRLLGLVRRQLLVRDLMRVGHLIVSRDCTAFMLLGGKVRLIMWGKVA